MKKIFAILLCVVLALSFACPVIAEEEDDYMWSEPGLKYIASLLAPQKEIHNEQEAEAYADSLWPLLTEDPLPEGNREMEIDQHDNSYHFGICNADGMALYNVSFLSNGVIQQISRRDTDPRRFDDSALKKPSELDPETWEQAKAKITEWVEKVSPGVLALVNPMEVYSVRDIGDRLYLYIGALPLDTENHGSLNIVAIIFEDGSVGILDYSLYGAG